MYRYIGFDNSLSYLFAATFQEQASLVYIDDDNAMLEVDDNSTSDATGPNKLEQIPPQNCIGHTTYCQGLHTSFHLQCRKRLKISKICK